MVNRPLTFVVAVIMTLILLVSIVIKILEQKLNSNPMWEDLGIVVWFGFESITTLGLGDYAPVHNISRLLTVVVMLVGIGLVSTISAKAVLFLVWSESTQQKIRSLKEDMKHKWVGFYTGQAHIHLPYNPLAQAFRATFQLMDYDVNTDGMVDSSPKVDSRTSSMTSMSESAAGTILSFGSFRGISSANSLAAPRRNVSLTSRK